MKMSICGAISGPVSHFWYEILDKRLPGKGATVVAQKVLIDQLFFTPIYICLYLGVVKLFERHEKAKSSEETGALSKRAIRLYVYSSAVWIPAQIFNFAVLPLKYRVLFDNIISFVSDLIFSNVIFESEN